MANITLEPKAKEIMREAIKWGKIIQRKWRGENGCACILATLVDSENDVCGELLERGISSPVIDEIINEFDHIPEESVHAYAERFAEVAQSSVDYEKALMHAHTYGVTFISSLEMQLRTIE